MALFITRCPHCLTTFRVSHAQMRVADGVARCGHCDEVFSAEEQRFIDNHIEQANILEFPAEENRRPQENRTDQNSLDEASFSDENDNLHESQNDDEYYLDDTSDPLDTSEEDSLLEELQGLTYLSGDKSIFEDDEHYKNHNQTNDLTADTDDDIYYQTVKTENEEPTLSGSSSDDTEAPIDIANNIDELDQLVSQPSEQQAKTRFDFSAEFIDHSESSLQSTQTGFANINTERVSTETFYEDPDDKNKINPENVDLSTLEITPVELHTSNVRRDRRLKIIFSLIGVFALCSLVSQYFIYNFEQLSENSRFDPVFKLLCPYINCPQTPTVDVAAIRSDDLLVRSHPSISGALQITFIFRNTATFEQDFPLVELNFSSMNNVNIASRSFTPEEYLPEELHQFNAMPVNSPIQAELAIVDPGPEAVNYTLQFRLR